MPFGGERGRGAQPRRMEALQNAFLHALSKTGVIAHACEATGVPRTTQQNWRKDPIFAERFDDAMQTAADELESEARRRAIGFNEPVIDPKYGVMYLRNPDGSLKLDDDFQPIVLTKRVYSDALMSKMLEAKKSEFRTKSMEHTGPGGMPLAPPQKIILKFVKSDGNGGALVYDTPSELLQLTAPAPAPLSEDVIDVESHEFDPLED